jgi:hypothetical protein
MFSGVGTQMSAQRRLNTLLPTVQGLSNYVVLLSSAARLERGRCLFFTSSHCKSQRRTQTQTHFCVYPFPLAV